MKNIIVRNGTALIKDGKIMLKALAEALPIALSPRVWFDAFDTDTIIHTGGLVSEWRDKSGNKFHASQTDDALKPSLVQTDFYFGNKQMLSFNRDVLVGGEPFSTGNINYTVFFVGRAGTNFIGAHMFSFGSQTGPTGSAFGLKQNSGADLDHYYSNSALKTLKAGMGIPNVTTIMMNSGARSTRINKALKGSDTANGLNLLDSKMYIGGNPSNTLNHSGLICEFIAYDRALTPEEIDITEAYLTEKWIA